MRLFNRRKPVEPQLQDARLKGTIFIVTYGRSGSTLLQSMLQTIPGAHIAGENFNTLAALFNAASRAARTRQKWGRKVRAGNHPWFGADQVTPARFERRLVEVFTAEILHPPANARWIGFKEIRYQTLNDEFEPMLDFIARNFPNPHFVFNTRNAENVVKSAFWGKQPEEKTRSMVATMDARFADYAAKHPERCFVARHESTVADPASLAPLFEQLGEPMDVERLREVLAVPLKH